MVLPFDSVKTGASLFLLDVTQSHILEVSVAMKDRGTIHTQIVSVVQGPIGLKNTMIRVSRDDVRTGKMKFFLTMDHSVQSALAADKEEQDRQEKSFRAHHR